MVTEFKVQESLLTDKTTRRPQITTQAFHSISYLFFKGHISMEVPIYFVDAFTNLPFKGNPAAVCLLQHALQDEMYQKIAAEINLSETAFVIPLKSSDFTSEARFALRWFTPTNEVPLCGHATLASAAVLFYLRSKVLPCTKHSFTSNHLLILRIPHCLHVWPYNTTVTENINPAVVFETLSGDLCVRQNGESLVMDFPLNKPIPLDPHEFTNLIQVALGDLVPQDVRYCHATKKLLVRLADTCDRSVLTSLKPDPEKLLRTESRGKITSLIVTMKGAPTCQPGYDFYSRNFAPWNGIPEDPVTGSAHTVLAGYWAEELGKQKMLAYQCSKRGGELELEIKGDRVDISGRAVVVLQGTLTP
ncbi:phenazine biosynthesis-like domain-containing protein 1 isoform X1 [Denticeps clupeoides]|uniref:phenazine biosynthesis-like domain-containing protein 1 isoform X1 n=1 Tax=Denticeps clupeoides TaxID=299321 RepID=UPI0010A50ADD|nr:phenazine biosynthesis-like domain-containing protein 1 isoform X1 [Denticeps clupeoides]